MNHVSCAHYSGFLISVNKVYQCLRDRNLTLNEDKTIFMTFSFNLTFSNYNLTTIHKCVDGNGCNYLN